jgi:hypothetical protein
MGGTSAAAGWMNGSGAPSRRLMLRIALRNETCSPDESLVGRFAKRRLVAHQQPFCHPAMKDRSGPTTVRCGRL